MVRLVTMMARAFGLTAGSAPDRRAQAEAPACASGGACAEAARSGAWGTIAPGNLFGTMRFLPALQWPGGIRP